MLIHDSLVFDWDNFVGSIKLSPHRSSPDVVDNIVAVYYAATTNDNLNVLVRGLAYTSLSALSRVAYKADLLHMYSQQPRDRFFTPHYYILLVWGTQDVTVLDKATITPSILR